MIKQLKDYADIRTGRSFRGAIKSSKTPTHRVVQISDVGSRSEEVTINYDELVACDLSAAREVECLEDNTVLMLGKGSVKPILLLNNVPPNVICTQHFLVVSPKSGDVQLNALFLKSYINSEFARKWIAANAGGNYQSTLSKRTLEKLPVPDLGSTKGSLFIDYAISVDNELSSYREMISARRSQMEHAIECLMENEHE